MIKRIKDFFRTRRIMVQEILEEKDDYYIYRIAIYKKRWYWRNYRRTYVDVTHRYRQHKLAFDGSVKPGMWTPTLSL